MGAGTRDTEFRVHRFRNTRNVVCPVGLRRSTVLPPFLLSSTQISPSVRCPEVSVTSCRFNFRLVR